MISSSRLAIFLSASTLALGLASTATAYAATTAPTKAPQASMHASKHAGTAHHAKKTHHKEMKKAPAKG